MIPILFRGEEEEQKVAADFFEIETTRCGLMENPSPIVIGRYSVLPYYKELEEDLKYFQKSLINSHKQHRYIAGFNWYEDFKKFTPKTWFDHNFHEAPEGRYVLKGETNSRKFTWNKTMFAPDKRRAIGVASELANDGLICGQRIIYREYIPLKTFEYALHDLPITNEWRFFFYKQDIVAYGYYWSNFIEQDVKKTIDHDGLRFASEMAKIAAPHVNFYVIDIAETENGDWIVIELNDGQMSGLSDCDPKLFYANLSYLVNKEQKHDFDLYWR